MHSTRRDPGNRLTIASFAHLTAAQYARQQYDQLLTQSIGEFGDRHTPDKPHGVLSACLICKAHGLTPSEHESLNHQTGSVISGIYSDHFPDPIKDQLRAYAWLITEETQIAFERWIKAGRRASTFREISQVFRTLPDGRISFY